MGKIFLALILLLAAGGCVWVWANRGEDRIEKVFLTQAEIQRHKDSQMTKQLQEITATQSGKYALKVYRLENGESYGFNTDMVMPARSAVKVPIIVTAIKLGLDKQYDDLLLRMGKNSDNNAQEKIVRIIGVDNLGISNYSENTTTADDLVEIWKKIYAEKETYDKYFTNSIYEDRIAKGIPREIKLIHKVGTDVDIWNDSGIVMAQKPFILVILNEGIKREEAEKMVPELTRMVWSYETNR